MKNNENVAIKSVILNLIWDLQRLLLLFVNGVRGRCQIKFGMTHLYNNAFTLIELLVVVLIIGILAAVALPQYKKAVAKSRFTQAKLTAHELAQAQEVYYLANGQYATTLDQLDIEAPGNITGNRIVIGRNVSCHLYDSNISCWLQDFDSGKFMYQAFYLHTEQDLAGKRRCIAYPDANSVSYQLCKADTQLTQPDSTPSAYAYFTYP